MFSKAAPVGMYISSATAIAHLHIEKQVGDHKQQPNQGRAKDDLVKGSQAKIEIIRRNGRWCRRSLRPSCTDGQHRS